MLERELGVALFLRRKKRLHLTDAGHAFLAEASKSVEQFEYAKTVAKRAQRGEVGEFAIGFGPTAGLGVLPRILRDFRRAYPRVDLLLRELGTDGQVQGLEAGELDVAIGYTRADENKFSVRLLAPERLIVLLPRGHRLIKHRALSVRQLKDEPLILPRRSAAATLNDAVSTAYASQNLVPRLAHQVETPQTAYALVAGGLGLSITTSSTQMLSSPAVVRLPLRDKHPAVQLTVFWRMDQVSPVLTNFVALLGSKIER